MVEVPRAEVVELLGLPADVSDEDLGRALTQALESAGEAALVSAAEARARAEDRSIVAAAVNDGRLHPTRLAFWLDALQRDRAGCRQVIASLMPGLKPVVPIEDPNVEIARQGVAAALKRVGINPPPRPVAAAAAPLPAPGVVTDSIGGSLSQIPAPVQFTTSGRAPAEWTQAERNAETVKQMFPWMAPKIGPAPGTTFTYVPTGNETHLPQQAADGSIEWVERPGYKPSAD
jgi:hypothetical protein